MVNISEIAKAAKVSPATVTRVVNNNGYVSKEKRKAILSAIEEYGYIPNQIAGNLRRKKTNFIGYILSELSDNLFFTRFGNAFDQAAQEAGYQVITMITHLKPEREKQLVASLVGMMVEAIVFLGSPFSTENIEWVLSRGVPVIMIERPVESDGIDAVLIDNYRAVHTALDHIIKKGHRNIAFIGREPFGEVEKERLRGFTEGMGKRGYNIPEHYLCTMPDYMIEYGKQGVCRAFDNGEPPTAILATSDLLACGVLQELYKRNIRVPEDVSLVGFDNTLSSLCSPPITSVELQPDVIGAAAVDMIIERCQKDRTSAKKVIYGTSIIDRGSVKAI